MMQQTEAVATWIAELNWNDLPSSVISQAKRCFIDHLGCVAGGTQSEPGRIAADAAVNWGGPPEATIVGSAQRVAARHAAFANATAANALDFDDTYYGHPGATTFPAALAAAEKWQRSGKEFLIAAILGYEISYRAMALMKPLIGRYQDMWDLGSLQAFGSAASAARLAGLPASGVMNALGLMSGIAPMPLPRKQRNATFGRSMLKSAYGWSADSGIVSAELTIAGFSGPGLALDDNLGFWTVEPISDQLRGFADGLGYAWAILNVEFKPYMACRFIHPVLQAVEDIMERRETIPRKIRRVEINTFALLGDEHHYILRPKSGTDAQFSVPYTVAVTLSKGRITAESYEPSCLYDQEILDLADRVVVTTEPRFDAAYPRRLGAQVDILFEDGSMESATISHPKGSLEDGTSDEALREKYYALTDQVFGYQRAHAIVQLIEDLDHQNSLVPLMALLAKHD